MENKKYALWIYHRNKSGYEQWQYIRDIETDAPVGYVDKYFRELSIRATGVDLKPNIKAVDGSVKIHKLKFASMYCAYHPLKMQEVVITERIELKDS